MIQPESIQPIQTACAIFAALLGLAFGSFLNVCLSRLPEGESIVHPRSHCRHCDHTLAWWENLPLLSWIILRGRCRQCRAWIGIRYPLVELAVAALWTSLWFYCSQNASQQFGLPDRLASVLFLFAGMAILSWLLVALIVLDAEHFWLPDLLTLPGIALGFGFSTLLESIATHRIYARYPLFANLPPGSEILVFRLLAVLLAAALILVIRLAYWLVRRKEGIGLGDAKLMALIAAWLGLPAALESFVVATFLATVAALVWVATPALRRKAENWAKMPLPLGTFLCLAALTEIFDPSWLFNWWWTRFMP